MDISVIICSHNPRGDYLQRVLGALQGQSLPKEQWELILIDNASESPLAENWSLSWHPNGRHVLEAELGLTPARLRGITEARTAYLAFVDDDNVLAPDYLEVALRTFSEYPMLAAIGGSISAEYEISPPGWFEGYEGYIGVKEFEGESWSNDPSHKFSTPVGAGMLITRDLGHYYRDALRGDKRRKHLDRKGGSLVSSGDIDIAMTACDMGRGKGVFSFLNVTHLIPASRLELSYLVRLFEAQGYSCFLQRHYRGEDTVNLVPHQVGFGPLDLVRRLRRWWRQSKHPPEKGALARAWDNGIRRGNRECAQ